MLKKIRFLGQVLLCLVLVQLSHTLLCADIQKNPSIEDLKNFKGDIFEEEAKKVEVEPDQFFWAFINMALALSLLVTFLVLLGYFVRRLTSQRLRAANSTGEIHILDQRMVSQRSALYLVEVKGKEFLVGESTQGINTIAPL